jgi:ubiquinone/menaquinone biosynthesis C-methylase UbiE
MSNSVLEHIPMVGDVLAEVARVLKPGAPFVFCVPNHNFWPILSVSNFFDRIGLRNRWETATAAFSTAFHDITTATHLKCGSERLETKRVSVSIATGIISLRRPCMCWNGVIILAYLPWSQGINR